MLSNEPLFKDETLLDYVSLSRLIMNYKKAHTARKVMRLKSHLRKKCTANVGEKYRVRERETSDECEVGRKQLRIMRRNEAKSRIMSHYHCMTL